MSCITYFNNDTSGLQVYISGYTCGGVYTAVTLNYLQGICMDNDFEIITCGNADIGADCLPQITPSLTPTISLTPSVTKSPTPTPSVTAPETQTPTPTQTHTQTPTPSVTIGLTPTSTESPTPTPTITPTSTLVVSPTPTNTQTPTISPTTTGTPTATPTPTNSGGCVIDVSVDNNATGGIEIDIVYVNGVAVTYDSGDDFPVEYLQLGNFTTTENGSGLTIDVSYTSHTGQKHINLVDCNGNSYCIDGLNSAGGTAIFQNVDVSCPCNGGIQIIVVNGACI